MYFDRDELLRLRRELNANPKLQFADGSKAIEGLTNKEIKAGIKHCLGELAKMDPENWQEGLPPRAVELYRSMGGKSDDSHLFFKVPRWLIDDRELEELTPPEWYVLTVFASFAYFGKGTSENGTMFGETFVGRERVALLTGFSVASVDRIIKSLVEKGHLENRKRGRNKVVRAVMFMVGSGEQC